MLHGAYIDLFNPLVPKAHNNIESQNILLPSQQKSVKAEVSLLIFIFPTLALTLMG